MNVRNNREYDALTKEIEFQNLEIELEEKKEFANLRMSLIRKISLLRSQEPY